MKRVLFFIFVFLLAGSQVAHAIQENKPLAIDKRIRTYVYNPNEVYVFTAHYGYQSEIELDPKEAIGVISLGNAPAWQVDPMGNRIFIKPIEPDATTNMTIITDKHTYHFELYAEEAESIRDEKMVFTARFYYPEIESGAVRTFKPAKTLKLPNIKEEPEKYHFNYTLSGSEGIAPLRVFDDGEFTYFQFRNKNADVPAFFMVDNEGRESLVNYRVLQDYIVVERVASQFTLRNGDEVTCVFNESRPLQLKKLPEKKKSFWSFL